MKIRIEGDNTTKNRKDRIHVVNADTGEELQDVMKVEIILDASDPDSLGHPKAIITIFNPVLAITVDAEVKESGG